MFGGKPQILHECMYLHNSQRRSNIIVLLSLYVLQSVLSFCPLCNLISLSLHQQCYHLGNNTV